MAKSTQPTTDRGSLIRSVAIGLEDGAAWVAATALKEEGAPAVIPTLRNHLLRALGCDPKAGAIAYWDWQEIDNRIGECWTALEPIVGPKPEMWSNDKNRTVYEVIAALNSVKVNLSLPDLPYARRPWSDPHLVRTCRIPFIPVATVMHISLAEATPLREVLDRLRITTTTDPWDILHAADPIARTLVPHDDILIYTDAIRSWMLDQIQPCYSPALALYAAAEVIGCSSTFDGLRTWCPPTTVFRGVNEPLG